MVTQAGRLPLWTLAVSYLVRITSLVVVRVPLLAARLLDGLRRVPLVILILPLQVTTLLFG
jgi:uncharacterized membrane protein